MWRAAAIDNQEGYIPVSTPESIERHHHAWSDLPSFPQWPYVMDDSDVEAWSDILHMRTLVDQIEDLLDINPAREALAAGLVEFDIDLYLEPWPDIDVAADMLAAWKQCGHRGATRLEVL